MTRIVFGVNAVLELLKAGREEVGELILAEGRGHARIKEIMGLARSRGVKIRRRPRPELTRLAGDEAHQGVAVLVSDFTYLDLEEMLAQPGLDLVVVLDGVQDPRNLGAVARSALAAGAGGMIIPKDRAAPVSPAAVKAAAGALSRLPVARVVNLNQTAVRLKEAGFWLLGASPHAPVSLFDLPGLPGKMALVLGAEDKGLNRALAAKCDFLAGLPLAETVESLNVSAAAAIMLFEIVRRRFLEKRQLK